MAEESKDVNVVIPTVTAGGNEKVLSSILELTDQVDRLVISS